MLEAVSILQSLQYVFDILQLQADFGGLAQIVLNVWYSFGAHEYLCAQYEVYILVFIHLV